VRRLVAGFPGSAAVYVEDLGTGAAAAWNARATFPAASTLKYAIAVTLLSRTDGPPPPGSSLDRLLRRMLDASDNESANRLLITLGGSTSGGGHAVDGVMRSIGLERTVMYGGYILGTELGAESDSTRDVAGRGVPLSVVDQPYWGVGKSTTAADLAQLHRAVWLASGGLGPLSRTGSGVSPAEARYLLYVLAHVRDHGKLGRFVDARPGVAVLHKAGWIDAARHDVGLVVWRGGILVAAVMTHRPAGAGTRSDVLAGRVAQAALRRFRG
jgi:beta-lactamase class A